VSDVFVAVAGRWDPSLAIISLTEALKPETLGSGRAVVARPRATPDVPGPEGTMVAAAGLPVSLAVDAIRRRAYVVNHAGRTPPAIVAGVPHGHAGSVAVLDLEAALDPGNDRTLGAVQSFVETGTGGPVGCALTPDGRHLLVTSAEGLGTEDGGFRISVIDAPAARKLHDVRLAASGEPSRLSSPDPGFGRFPNPNGIAIAPSAGLVFTGNGGSNDVSVLRLADVLRGGDGAEIARIAVSSGPFGLALSPDETVLAVACREDARTGAEGRTVALIDVSRAALLAEVAVGSDFPGQAARPTCVAFAADGALYATCMRSGTVSRIEPAPGGGWRETGRVALRGIAGASAQPRGIAVTPDGRFVLACGGRRAGPGTSVLWVLEAGSLAARGRVTGVGDEAYLLAPFEL
jgi:DNA-binding beta-propeller fold protein YncE